MELGLPGVMLSGSSYGRKRGKGESALRGVFWFIWEIVRLSESQGFGYKIW